MDFDQSETSLEVTRWARRVIASSLIFACLGLSPQPAAQTSPSEEGHDPNYTGRYPNYDYGYDILLPKGVVAIGNRAPNPNHGFGIDLDAPSRFGADWPEKEPAAFIWADASYDASERGTLTRVVGYQLQVAKERVKGFLLLRRSPARLDSLPAVRILFRHRKDEQTVIEEQVVAIRRGAGIVYTIGLITSPTRYTADKRLYEEVVKGFRLRPVPR